MYYEYLNNIGYGVGVIDDTTPLTSTQLEDNKSVYLSLINEKWLQHFSEVEWGKLLKEGVSCIPAIATSLGEYPIIVFLKGVIRNPERYETPDYIIEDLKKSFMFERLINKIINKQQQQNEESV